MTVPITYFKAIRKLGNGPSMPPSDEEVQPVLNPPINGGVGSGQIPPVAQRYDTEAAMIADQANQESGYLYFDGTNTWWYLGTIGGVIGDYQEFGGGGSGLPPVDGSYGDQAAMIADQANQTANYFYYDGTSYWEYLGATTGTIADYRSSLNLWTAGSGFIYRTGSVVVTERLSAGFTTQPAGAWHSVKGIDDGGVSFRVTNSSNTVLLDVSGSGGIIVPRRMQVGNTSYAVGSWNEFKSLDSSTTGILRLTNSSNVVRFEVKGNGLILFSEGGNIQLGITTGTKIGTENTQKLAFWNATPIVQPLETALANTSNSGDANTDALIEALKNIILNTGLGRSA